jgi:acetyl esterase/lipase
MTTGNSIALATALAVLAGAAPVRAGEIDVTYGQTYAERDSGPLLADIYVPRGEGPFPGVLVVHGGAWRLGSRAQLAGIAQVLAQHGLTAVAINYRLAPAHKFPAQIEDCRDAVRWMRAEAAKWKIDPEHIGGFGYSAGAQLVSLLGTHPEGESDDDTALPSSRLQAVAAGGTPCDFRPIPADIDGLAFWLGGTPGELPEQYRLASPAAFITADDPPFFFFHGENDQIVPVVSPTQMHAALIAAGVSADLYVVPKLGHIACCMNQAAIEKAVGFLETHLKAPAVATAAVVGAASSNSEKAATQ